MAASLQDYANDIAQKLGLSPSLFSAQIQQESSFGTNLGSIGNIGQVTQGALTDVNNAFGTSYTEQGIAADPVQGLEAAGAYDKLQYDATGSYTGMLENYGTIGSSPFNDNSNQSALRQLAENLDTFGSTSVGQPVENPSAPLSSVAGNQSLTSAISNGVSFLTSGQGWERIGVIVIGIVLLGVAGFMLATKGFEGTVRTVEKAA
jgi:hypothetical protein